jgi:hypothetical protein
LVTQLLGEVGGAISLVLTVCSIVVAGYRFLVSGSTKKTVSSPCAREAAPADVKQPVAEVALSVSVDTEYAEHKQHNLAPQKPQSDEVAGGGAKHAFPETL